MAARLTEIVVDCHDPRAQARFWAEVLGYHVVRTEEDQVEISAWDGVAPDPRPTPVAPAVVFVTVPEGKQVKNRLHFDLRPVDGDYDAELARLTGLGATRADIGQGDLPWVVLADPEGNEFCLLGPLDP